MSVDPNYLEVTITGPASDLQKIAKSPLWAHVPTPKPSPDGSLYSCLSDWDYYNSTNYDKFVAVVKSVSAAFPKARLEASTRCADSIQSDGTHGTYVAGEAITINLAEIVTAIVESNGIPSLDDDRDWHVYGANAEGRRAWYDMKFGYEMFDEFGELTMHGLDDAYVYSPVKTSPEHAYSAHQMRAAFGERRAEIEAINKPRANLIGWRRRMYVKSLNGHMAVREFMSSGIRGNYWVVWHNGAEVLVTHNYDEVEGIRRCAEHDERRRRRQQNGKDEAHKLLLPS